MIKIEIKILSLTRVGADPLATSGGNRNALQLARKHEKSEVVQLLSLDERVKPYVNEDKSCVIV